MQWSRLFKAFTQCAALTGISRVTGLMRDVVCAHFFGAGPEFDAFLVAFQIPNFMRRLFAEGAMSQAFVPILTACQHESGRDRQRVLVNGALGTLISVLLIITVCVEFKASWIIRIYAPGFALQGDVRFELAVSLLRWTFPYLLLISMTAYFGAILNCHQRFMVTAAAPILLNVSLIVAAFNGGSISEEALHQLAYAVPIAGLLQLLWVGGHMVRLVGYIYPTWGWANEDVRTMWRLMLGALFGVSIAQIGLVIDTFLASFLVKGSVSWLYFSQRLVFLPLGLFGVAASTVILPKLSNPKQADAVESTLTWAVSMMCVLGVPAMMGLIVLAKPIIMTLFLYGAFDISDMVQTEYSLIALASGLPAFMLIKIFAAAFYARQDVKTPVKMGAYSLLLHVCLCLALMQVFAHAGLALAAACSGWFQLGLLGYRLYQLTHWTVPWRSIQQVLLATVLMTLSVWAVMHYLTTPMMWDTLKGRIFTLLTLIIIGLLTYGFSLWGLRWRLNPIASSLNEGRPA